VHYTSLLSDLIPSVTLDQYDDCLQFLVFLGCTRWASESLWKVATDSSSVSVLGSNSMLVAAVVAMAHSDKGESEITAGITNVLQPAQSGFSQRHSTSMLPFRSEADIVQAQGRCRAGLSLLLQTLSGLQNYFLTQIHGNIWAEFEQDIRQVLTNARDGRDSSSVSLLHIYDRHIAMLADVAVVTTVARASIQAFVAQSFVAIESLRDLIVCGRRIPIVTPVPKPKADKKTSSSGVVGKDKMAVTSSKSNGRSQAPEVISSDAMIVDKDELLEQFAGALHTSDVAFQTLHTKARSLKTELVPNRWNNEADNRAVSVKELQVAMGY
jgi:hypothetical protein